MMASDFIIDVNEADFELQVIAYSAQNPVMVDFWAEWCAPCRILSPILEKLTNEAQGGFRMARVNVDENPNLARQYQVRSIPAVKVFSHGKMVSEFVGVQPEHKIRDFIKAFAPSQSDLDLEKGISLLKLGDPLAAEGIFRQVLTDDPEQPSALLGLAKSLVLLGDADESLHILRQFPESREYSSAQILLPLVEAMSSFDPNGVNTDNALDAAYTQAIRLAKRGNYEAALDGMLDILRQDKRFKDGNVRKVIVAIFELFGEDSSITRDYRNELASVLF